jgi:trimethylamine:corrinoid methyltransferase-like protein
LFHGCVGYACRGGRVKGRRSTTWNDSEGRSPVFVNKMPRYEILSEDAMETLDRGWRRIVSELGIEFLLEESLEEFRKAGQKVEGQNVKLDPEFVLEQVARRRASSTSRRATRSTACT